MTSIDQAGTYQLGGRSVRRIGYGAMQLAGPGVFGPPKDPDWTEGQCEAYAADLRALLAASEIADE